MNKLFFRYIFVGALLWIGIASNGVAQEDSGDPFSVSVTYMGDVFANTMGGKKTGVRYVDNIDINLEVNFNRLPLSFDGATFYIYGLGNQGASISDLVGDAQGISNIEAENSWRIFEIWAQKKFFLTNSSLLVGLYDINSEFNVLNSSLLFLNSSHGLDPTIALSGTLGPSTFPYTSLAARLKINPYNGWVIQAAILDGVPSNPGNTEGTKIFLRKSDGIFGIAEIGYNSFTGDNLQLRNRTARLQNILAPGLESDNKLAVGGWLYSKKKTALDDSGAELEYGIYALGEYELFNRNAELVGPRNLKLFGRAGFSNPDVAVLGSYFGAGFSLKGLFTGRENDQTGFGVARASASSSYINNIILNEMKPEQSETNFELTHRFVLNSYAKVQANVQYILSPGFNAALKDALVVGTRLMVGF